MKRQHSLRQLLIISFLWIAGAACVSADETRKNQVVVDCNTAPISSTEKMQVEPLNLAISRSPNLQNMQPLQLALEFMPHLSNGERLQVTQQTETQPTERRQMVVKSCINHDDSVLGEVTIWQFEQLTEVVGWRLTRLERAFLCRRGDSRSEFQASLCP